MTRLYGHRWVSSYGESDDGTWARVLRGVTAEQLAAAVDVVHEHHPEWPPTAGEFLNLCGGHREQPEERSAETRRIDLADAEYERRRPFPELAGTPQREAFYVLTGRGGRLTEEEAHEVLPGEVFERMLAEHRRRTGEHLPEVV